eukprot:Skav223044  [mRNA]  locus=scaffold1069:209520:218032:+ [translate_table: standard]
MQSSQNSFLPVDYVPPVSAVLQAQPFYAGGVGDSPGVFNTPSGFGMLSRQSTHNSLLPLPRPNAPNVAYVPRASAVQAQPFYAGGVVYDGPSLRGAPSTGPVYTSAGGGDVAALQLEVEHLRLRCQEQERDARVQAFRLEGQERAFHEQAELLRKAISLLGDSDVALRAVFQEMTRLSALIHSKLYTRRYSEFLRRTGPLAYRLGIPVRTWLIHHLDFPRCDRARLALLGASPQSWSDDLVRVWRDRCRQGHALKFYVVRPHPLDNGDRPDVLHVLISQGEALVPHSRAIVLSSVFGWDRANVALALASPCTVSHVIWLSDYGERCAVGDPWTCSVWMGTQELLHGRHYDIRSGSSYVLEGHYRQPRQIDAQTSTSVFPEFGGLSSSDPDHQEVSLLQLTGKPVHPIAEQVAHTQQPGLLDQRTSPPRKVLDLDSLLPCALCNVEAGSVIAEAQIQLRLWGHFVRVYQIDERPWFLCLSEKLTDQADVDIVHVAYFQKSMSAVEEIFFHTVKKTQISELHHMQFLHGMGFRRAVIFGSTSLDVDWLLVEFHNNIPTMELRPESERLPTPWPPYSHLPATHRTPFDVHFEEADQDQVPVLHFGRVLLTSRASLFRILTFFVIHASYDRYVIFTDGISYPKFKHKSPEWNEEFHRLDAWAFLVIGEKRMSDDVVTKHLVGWTTQQVCYDPTRSSFVGSWRLGPDLAEKEGVFCIDSSTTEGQAAGTLGLSSMDTVFLTMRGLYQLLQVALGSERVGLRHVNAHSGDPFNDFVDFVAKSEATSSHSLARQQVDLPSWTPVIPHLWMLFGQQAGLPVLGPDGFWLTRPMCPSRRSDPAMRDQNDHDPKHYCTCRLALSLISSNASLYFDKRHFVVKFADPQAHLWVLIDADAKSGGSDSLVVHEIGDLESCSTALWRSFLEDQPLNLGQLGSRFGLDEAAVRELSVLLLQSPAVEEAHLPGTYQLAVSAIHSHTWFRFHAQTDLVATSHGSRPGDSFADILFGFVYSKVFRSIHRQLTHLDLLAAFPVDGPGTTASSSTSSRHLLGPTWMDDTAICLLDEDASRLERKLMVAASVVLDTCRSFGMSPNLAPGKTAIVSAFRGRHSRAQRLKHFGPKAKGTISVMTESGLEEVAITGTYTHLGGVFHHDGQFRRENYFKPWCSVLSTLQLRQTFRAAVLRLYKRLLRVAHDAKLTDEEVIRQAELPHPEVLLRLARLRYFGLLVSCGDCIDWGLIRADRPWLGSDFVWMWEQLQFSSDLQHPEEHMAQWLEILIHAPKFWKRLLRRAVLHDAQQARNRAIVAAFHKEIFVHLDRCGKILPPPPTDRGRPFTRPFACLSCRRQFRSKGGEGAHMFKCHGIVAPTRHLFASTTCGACLKDYFSYSKLKAHLRYSKHCRMTLGGRRDRCLPQPGAGSLVDRQLLGDHGGLAPAAPGEGPQQLPDTLVEFRQCVDRFAVSWSQLSDTLSGLCEPLTEEELELVDLSRPCIAEAVEWALNPSTWDFLQDCAADQVLQDFYAHNAWLADMASWPSCPWVPHGRVPRLVGQHRYTYCMPSPGAEGKSSLRLGVLANVTVGNVLMGFALQALFHIQAANALGLCEHPADPNEFSSRDMEDAAATISRTPVMATLLRLQGVSFRVMQQGLFGSNSAKPTGLVAVNLPTLDQRLSEWRLTRTSPSDRSYGLDSNGSFRSAPVKEYPPAMCRSLALAFLDSMASAVTTPAQNPPREFRDLCTGMVASDICSTIGNEGLSEAPSRLPPPLLEEDGAWSLTEAPPGEIKGCSWLSLAAAVAGHAGAGSAEWWRDSRVAADEGMA